MAAQPCHFDVYARNQWGYHGIRTIFIIYSGFDGMITHSQSRKTHGVIIYHYSIHGKDLLTYSWYIAGHFAALKWVDLGKLKIS